MNPFLVEWLTICITQLNPSPVYLIYGPALHLFLIQFSNQRNERHTLWPLTSNKETTRIISIAKSVPRSLILSEIGQPAAAVKDDVIAPNRFRRNYNLGRAWRNCILPWDNKSPRKTRTATIKTLLKRIGIKRTINTQLAIKATGSASVRWCKPFKQTNNMRIDCELFE